MSNEDNVLSFFNEKVGQCFIDATTKTIESYFGAKPSKMTPMLAYDPKIAYAIAGIMTFEAHDVKASMIVAFEQKFVLKIFEHMLGEKTDTINNDVIDCVSELTNIIYGSAKSPLSEIGYQFPMSRPQTVTDVNSFLHHSKVLELPFKVEVDQGKEFALILVVHQIKNKVAA